MFTRPARCPNQECRFRDGPDGSERLYGSTRFWIKRGHYRTKHDRRAVPRYSCRACGKCFNSRTGTPTAGQHKPHMNRQVFGMLCSGMTQRRTAEVAGIARRTVERKFRWLTSRAAEAHADALHGGCLETSFIQFDDMESVEHTKLKPLTLALAVRASTGQIIDARVGTITCKHRKADSERRYGKRADERTRIRREALESVAMCAKPGATVATDELNHYRRLIAETVPGAKHRTHVSSGRRDGCDGGFDPLFRINHTCAKMRADIARLRRKTWCISKLASRLQDHLNLYIAWQNKYRMSI